MEKKNKIKKILMVIFGILIILNSILIASILLSVIEKIVKIINIDVIGRIESVMYYSLCILSNITGIILIIKSKYNKKIILISIISSITLKYILFFLIYYPNLKNDSFVSKCSAAVCDTNECGNNETCECKYYQINNDGTEGEPISIICDNPYYNEN